MGERVKRADGAVAVARLEREASMLALARHPSVVEFVAFRPDGPHAAELHTVELAATPLASLPALDPRELAGLVASVAATLADLHDAGIVHGRVDSTHLLVGPVGAVSLCGFADAGLAGEHRPDGTPWETRDDLIALARLVEHELARAGLSAPAPGEWQSLRAALGARPVTLVEKLRVFGGRRSPGAQPVAVAGALRTIAGLISGNSAVDTRAVASLVPRRVPQARLPASPASPATPARRRRQARLPVARAFALAVPAAALGLGTVAVAAPPAGEAGRAAAPITCAPVPGLRGDLDGDGCDEAISFDAGEVVSSTTRLRVGQPTDVVATGDWDCNGSATLALMRPSTGQFWLFDRWPDRTDGVTPARGGVHAGAASITVDRSARCDSLVVITADGRAIRAALRPGT